MPPNPAAQGPWHGHGPKFSDAMEDAAKKAKDERGPGEYKVLEIRVDVVNPIRDYRIILGV